MLECQSKCSSLPRPAWISPVEPTENFRPCPSTTTSTARRQGYCGLIINSWSTHNIRHVFLSGHRSTVVYGASWADQTVLALIWNCRVGKIYKLKLNWRGHRYSFMANWKVLELSKYATRLRNTWILVDFAELSCSPEDAAAKKTNPILK